MSFHDLEKLERKTKEQKEFIDNFYEFCPVLIRDSPMNLLCKYIESINFGISQKTKVDAELFDYEIYKPKGNGWKCIISLIVTIHHKKFTKN